jgi:GNAT superfamily N-acetyltransferase
MIARWSVECLSGRSELTLDDGLVQDASEDGFHFVDRLVNEWRDGVNRFDEPGEILLGVFVRGRTIAVGGLNRDLAYKSGVGRIRHLYVRPAFRGRGVGSALVDRLEHHARRTFETLRLRTDTLDAARFYERRGYKPVDSESATHVLRLADIEPTTDGH